MSIVNHFINESMRQLEINDFLERELTRAGFGGAEIMRTPLGTRIIIYAMKPGVVIGRRGTNIRELTRLLEEKFELFNPQIAVSEVEVPELNANIMASRIADALQRGIHFTSTRITPARLLSTSNRQRCTLTRPSTSPRSSILSGAWSRRATLTRRGAMCTSVCGQWTPTASCRGATSTT